VHGESANLTIHRIWQELLHWIMVFDEWEDCLQQAIISYSAGKLDSGGLIKSTPVRNAAHLFAFVSQRGLEWRVACLGTRSSGG